MDQTSDWFRKSEAQAIHEQGSTLEHGISEVEAHARRQKYGANVLEERSKKKPWLLFLSQFNDLLVFVLMGAAVIAGLLGEPEDSIAIGLIVLLNGVLGFFQEYRAEKAMAALRALAAPFAKVKRQGEVLVIPAHELVPGDIVLLESGNSVPADLRLLESHGLMINESLFTGESQVVSKVSPPLLEDGLPVSDQRNMAFKGTQVASGRGVGLVVRIGMQTELGKIAKFLREEVEIKTPLQRRMAVFTRRLSYVILAVCSVIFGVGLLRGEAPIDIFLTSVSLAVAGIPEALPTIVTIALALGAKKMSHQRTLVRKLPAVEALGSVTVICADKTGTLTENRMEVQRVRVGKQTVLLDDSHFEFFGADWDRLLEIVILNNDSTRTPTGEWHGDPTETALMEFGTAWGRSREVDSRRLPRLLEIGFSSERLMMSTLHQNAKGQILFVKGAPEKVLPLCSKQLIDGKEEEFSAWEELRIAEEFAQDGQRVLALAFRSFDDRHADPSVTSIHAFEVDLTYVGLIGLMDPPRPQVAESISACRKAGIAVVMMTGDHPTTARAVGKKIGLLADERSDVMLGRELAQLSEEALEKKIKNVGVFARVVPEQKIRIVKALQALGEVVAMTGDGVNDAPALKSADVGVSMGKSGTDVAREASHIILMDDQFESIVAAVREGRRIFDNIRKFVRFALSGNTGEIWTLFLAPFLGLPTPLLPIQILWINLVTDGLPGIALAFEPAERMIMERAPRDPKESLFAQGLWQHVLYVGLLTAGVTLGVMGWAYRNQSPHWQSMAFTVLTLIQMGHVIAIRSERTSIFTLGIRSNIFLDLAVLLTFSIQMATLYIPGFNTLLKTQPLTPVELFICGIASFVVFCVVEAEKLIRRIRV